MRKSPDSNLDLRLAREVCLRDGAVRALIAGETRDGDAYLFSVHIMDPARNVIVATHSEIAARIKCGLRLGRCLTGFANRLAKQWIV